MDKSARAPLQKRQRRNSTAERGAQVQVQLLREDAQAQVGAPRAREAEPSSLWSSAITLGLSNEQEVELSNVQEVELSNVQEVELSNDPQAESMGRGASSPLPEVAGRPVALEPESDSRPPSITLCGGFAKVEHKKYYGPDTIQKGKKIVDHVANIREVRTWNTGAQFNGRADGFTRVDSARPVADQ